MVSFVSELPRLPRVSSCILQSQQKCIEEPDSIWGVDLEGQIFYYGFIDLCPFHWHSSTDKDGKGLWLPLSYPVSKSQANPLTLLLCHLLDTSTSIPC